MSGHHLPLLARERQDELSKCAYCPKLCRATCVVSEAEPREPLTPWGKMTSVFDAARTGSVDAERAGLAWACSNCMRCREACDHRNPVTETLNEARATYVALGHEPVQVRRLLERTPQILAEQRAAAETLARECGAADAGAALLLGCRYATSFREEARAAVRLTRALRGEVKVLTSCCGYWQRAAGDAEGADRTREALRIELGRRPLFVLDPRCALTLRELGAMTLVELAHGHLQRFEPRRAPAPYRYHDSCALGRGLGLYDEPRRLLERVTGKPPGELPDSRQLARCSGGGGVLPVTMPAVASYAANRLATEHERAGGGTLVTGCASSLSQLRRAGVPAVDLIALAEGGLRRGD